MIDLFKSPTPELLNDSQYQDALHREFKYNPTRNNFVKALQGPVDNDFPEAFKAVCAIYDKYIGYREFFHKLDNLEGKFNVPGCGLAICKAKNFFNTNIQKIASILNTTPDLPAEQISTIFHYLPFNHCWPLASKKYFDLSRITKVQRLNDNQISLRNAFKNEEFSLNFALANSLSTVNVSAFEKFTHNMLDSLAKALTNLTHLDLSKCHLITNTALQSLQGLTSLTYLNLGYCQKLSSSGLCHLKSLNLNSLDLSELSFDKLNDPHLGNLQNLPLKSLSLSRCCIKDDHLLPIKLPSLTYLNLDYCFFLTDIALKHLSELSLNSLSSLSSLSIVNSPFSHEAIKSLISLPLTFLDISNNFISPDELKIFKGVKIVSGFKGIREDW